MCTISRGLYVILYVFLIFITDSHAVHADRCKQEIEALNRLIQKKLPLKDIESSDVWRKIDLLTDDDIRIMKECPREAHEQHSFFAFHNQTIMQIYKYVMHEIQLCETQQDYDHEITLFDMLYSLCRLHILDVGLQRTLLGKLIYPLFISNKLSFPQKQKIIDICKSKVLRLPIEHFSWQGSELHGTETKKVKVYACSLITSEFLILVMETLLTRDGSMQATPFFEKHMQKLLTDYGMQGVYNGRMDKDTFDFYLITKEPLYFHQANQQGCLYNGVERVFIE